MDMKRIVFFVFALISITGCKEDVVNERIDQIASETSATAANGNGKIRLSSGSQMLSVEGDCGGVTTMGELIIAVKDKIVPSRVFTISFNTDQFPENGKVYTLKKSDYMTEGKKSESDVYVGFSEVSQSTQMDWSSDDHSGTIKFEVNGNEIKCTFKDIKLQPSEVYNKGELNQTGTVSGELNLYKN